MTTPSTEELTELLEKATPGPWWVDDRTASAQPNFVGERQIQAKHRGEGSSYCVAHVNRWENPTFNAALIVAAVNALPGLLAENERLKGDVSDTQANWAETSRQLKESHVRTEAAEAEVERLKLQLDNANKLWSPRIAMLEARANTAETSLKVMAAKAQAVVDATTQNPAGTWIVEGDGELLFSDLYDALTSLDQPVEAKLSALGGGEPVAWSYELAGAISNREYCAWQSHLSWNKPNVPEGSIRNLKALFALSTPANPWRPIKEAPDAETVLVAGGDALYPVTASWSGQTDECWQIDGQEDVHGEIGWPTHYMPLPAFPLPTPEED